MKRKAGRSNYPQRAENRRSGRTKPIFLPALIARAPRKGHHVFTEESKPQWAAARRAMLTELRNLSIRFQPLSVGR